MKNTGLKLGIGALVCLLILVIGYSNFYKANQENNIPDQVVIPTPKPVEIKTHPLIKVNSPQNGQRVQGSFQLTGQARGYWFFEASFPYVILDSNNKEISQGFVQAQEEWMTEDFVNFSKVIELPIDYKGTAKLVLKKDNPSGLPENDDQFILDLEVY